MKSYLVILRKNDAKTEIILPVTLIDTLCPY